MSGQGLQTLVPIQNLLVLCSLLGRSKDSVALSLGAELGVRGKRKLREGVAKGNSVRKAIK